MTIKELNRIITMVKKPDFKHLAKTYLRDHCINIAYRKKHRCFTLKSSFRDAIEVLKTMHK